MVAKWYVVVWWSNGSRMVVDWWSPGAPDREGGEISGVVVQARADLVGPVLALQKREQRARALVPDQVREVVLRQISGVQRGQVGRWSKLK
jgi:hypothetical protein